MINNSGHRLITRIYQCEKYCNAVNFMQKWLLGNYFSKKYNRTYIVDNGNGNRKRSG